MAFSLDDGEVLAQQAEGDLEEYVVAQSLSDDEFVEYLVPSAMAEASYSASLSEPSADVQQEYEVDILAPLSARQANTSQPNTAASPAASPALPVSATAAAQSMSARAPYAMPHQSPQPHNAANPVAPATNPARPQFTLDHGPGDNQHEAGHVSDDDFMADMQSILSGDSVFDPVSRKTVPKNAVPAREEPSSRPTREPERNNQHDIFERIAQSMQYANAYDLGEVELENRFADFDRIDDTHVRKAAAKPATVTAPASKPAGSAEPARAQSLSTAEFLADLDRVHEARSFSDDTAVAFGGSASDLQGDFVTSALQTVFSDASIIDQYFVYQGAQHGFIDWFNTNLAKKGPWSGIAIGKSAQTGFKAAWDRIPQIFGTSQINLLQFLSLASIMLNETGGTFMPIAERVGIKGHPGIAYAFDEISGLKASYNTGKNGWTAFHCFNDPDFIRAHGQKALGNTLANTTDERWKGKTYPDDMPTDVDPGVTGFIQEADFYKFRGRGLIQTTWRSAYKHLIEFVQNYSGNQPEILTRKTAWSGLTLDQAANVSSNADWDALFMHSDLEIPCVAIAQHNQHSGNYLNLSGKVEVLNGHDTGSIWGMGKRISGSSKYSDLFRSRVMAMCNLLGNGGN